MKSVCMSLPSLVVSCAFREQVCFGGGTIAKMKHANAEQCCTACQSHQGCTHFTYTPGDGECGLKKGTPVDSEHTHCTSGTIQAAPSGICKHVHSEVNLKYTPAAGSGARYFDIQAEHEPVCTLAGCGCRCRQSCETNSYSKFTHWSIDRNHDPTHKSWRCYCFEGTPDVAPKSESQGFYSGITKNYASPGNYAAEVESADEISDGALDVAGGVAAISFGCYSGDPVACAGAIVAGIITLVKDIYNAFTHKRTIDVALPMSYASTLKHIGQRVGGTAGESGTNTVFDQNHEGLHLNFHDDGPIGGCQHFQHTNCDYGLIVCVSNPLVGKNKARVAYGPMSSLPSMDSEWDNLHTWADVWDGSTASVRSNFNHYDNPSTIAYDLHVPDKCKISAYSNASAVV